jgi:hypothetical protein
MPAIDTILLSELKEFYPVTDSLSQDKINTQMNFVKNTTFLQMFGLAISKEIFAGTIPVTETADFLGFRKFAALCIVGLLLEDTYTHTNAGLKIINQQNWNSPKLSEKNITTVYKINSTIENQFIEAKKILVSLGKIPDNKYSGYSAIKITKI